MSELIEQIMKQYDVDLKGALEIIEQRNAIMTWFFNSYQPYGKVRH